MGQDLYLKSVLTIIALCLVIMTVKLVSPISNAHAMEGYAHCTGKIQANAWGGIKESIGGYEVDITCS